MAGTVKTAAIWLLRLGIGGIFAFAGVVKIWDFKAGDWATQDFALAVQNFQLTTWTISILIAVYLPWLELAAGVALILRKLENGALALLGLMTLGFLGAIGSAWARGLDITCGCFGKENNATNFPLHIAGDAALLAAIVLLAVLLRRGESPRTSPRHMVNSGGDAL